MDTKEFKITGIKLTDLSAFVLTARNKDNSEFYIRPKSDFERELELKEKNENAIVFSTANEGIKKESEIIEMIDSGIKFYTFNEDDKTFTEVIIVSENIKSINNKTQEDNIEKLPILSSEMPIYDLKIK